MGNFNFRKSNFVNKYKFRCILVSYEAVVYALPLLIYNTNETGPKHLKSLTLQLQVITLWNEPQRLGGIQAL